MIHNWQRSVMGGGQWLATGGSGSERLWVAADGDHGWRWTRPIEVSSGGGRRVAAVGCGSDGQ
ncbi:GST N-terminal domain-containing protein [Psidium guajava]|nr:GST N-terminal domain-containing protein [Psidium guajava]